MNRLVQVISTKYMSCPVEIIHTILSQWPKNIVEPVALQLLQQLNTTANDESHHVIILSLCVHYWSNIRREFITITNNNNDDNNNNNNNSNNNLRGSSEGPDLLLIRCMQCDSLFEITEKLIDSVVCEEEVLNYQKFAVKYSSCVNNLRHGGAFVKKVNDKLENLRVTRLSSSFNQICFQN
jgi:hypothetical protein